jgi:hypothetical protein
MFLFHYAHTLQEAGSSTVRQYYGDSTTIRQYDSDNTQVTVRQYDVE